MVHYLKVRMHLYMFLMTMSLSLYFTKISMHVSPRREMPGIRNLHI